MPPYPLPQYILQKYPEIPLSYLGQVKSISISTKHSSKFAINNCFRKFKKLIKKLCILYVNTFTKILFSLTILVCNILNFFSCSSYNARLVNILPARFHLSALWCTQKQHSFFSLSSSGSCEFYVLNRIKIDFLCIWHGYLLWVGIDNLHAILAWAPGPRML
jgi:hypothetical protein